MRRVCCHLMSYHSHTQEIVFRRHIAHELPVSRRRLRWGVYLNSPPFSRNWMRATSRGCECITTIALDGLGMHFLLVLEWVYELEFVQLIAVFAHVLVILKLVCQSRMPFKAVSYTFISIRLPFVSKEHLLNLLRTPLNHILFCTAEGSSTFCVRLDHLPLSNTSCRLRESPQDRPSGKFPSYHLPHVNTKTSSITKSWFEYLFGVELACCRISPNYSHKDASCRL